jgi:hypothetical protein
MMNGISVSEANLASSGLLTSRLIGGPVGSSSVGTAKTLRRDKVVGKPRRALEQSLVRGLLTTKTSSLSLKSLVRVAAISGKRLVLEIRDENPVRIVRTSTRGM